LEHQVMGPEHETHSAFAQYFVDAVSVSQYRSYETAQVSHCRIVGLDGHERRITQAMRHSGLSARRLRTLGHAFLFGVSVVSRAEVRERLGRSEVHAG